MNVLQTTKKPNYVSSQISTKTPLVDFGCKKTIFLLFAPIIGVFETN